jgi:hypothetical protein
MARARSLRAVLPAPGRARGADAGACREQLAVEQHELERHRVGRERRDRLPRVLAHARARLGIEQRAHVRRERGDVARAAHQARVVRGDELGDARLGARDHRQAARHRLERGVRARIVERGEHEHVAGAEIRARIGLRADDLHAPRQLERAREARVLLKVRVAPDDHEMRSAAAAPRARGWCSRDALALETRADQHVQRRLGRDPQQAHTRSRSARRPGWNTEASDGVADDVQLLFGIAEALADLVAHHRRVADDGREPGTREELPLGVEHAVVGARAERDALERRRVGEPLVEARRARRRQRGTRRAGDALSATARGPPSRRRSALHTPRAKLASRHSRPRWNGSTMCGSDQREARLRPFARVQRDRHAALQQRLERPLDEALGAAERRVALPDDREPHVARLREELDARRVNAIDRQRSQALGHLAAAAAVEAAWPA